MTFQDVIGLLQEANLPLAYDHFAEGESPDPPFIIFLFPGSNNMFADDSIYLRINELHVELYTDKKDPEIESMLEDIFAAHDILWEKTEAWIESEKLYEILYVTEITGG